MCHLFAHQPERDYESQTRSLRMGGHCTSIRLEMAFWDTLEEIAAKEGMSLAKFLTTLHDEVLDHHGEAPHHFADRFGFGAVGLEKLQPCRGGIKQIADLDAGAVRERSRHDLRFRAALDRQRPCMRLRGVAGGDAELCHRADRGQGLAAEPERANP